MDEERDECLEATKNLLQSYPVVDIAGDYILNMDDCNIYEEQVVSDVTATGTTDGDLGGCLQQQQQQQQQEETQSESEITSDLTSLNWLHNITNIMAVPNLPTPPVSPKPTTAAATATKRKVQNGGQQEDLTININYYKKNGDKKPPFSYATLICMAMGRNGNKMTLSAIYHWIRENFLYYRKAHPSWQVRFGKKH